MILELDGADVILDGVVLPPRTALHPELYDALVALTEQYGGVDSGELGSSDSPCCPWGFAVKLDDMPFKGNYNWENPGVAMCGLALLGRGYTVFDEAIGRVQRANGKDIYERVPLKDVFAALGIVRGAA